jgi:hypothetical protein
MLGKYSTPLSASQDVVVMTDISAKIDSALGLINAAFQKPSLILIRNGLIILKNISKKIDKIKNGSKSFLVAPFSLLTFIKVG